MLPLTWNEALSGISGSISLAAWIFLLLPQLLENYQQGHADGISLTFLFIWALGDITNLIGAVWAGLVPTVIALAVYFCFADTALIAQCIYYNVRNKRRAEGHGDAGESGEVGEGEQTPLLNGSANGDANGSPKTTTKPQKKRRLTDVTSENIGLPGSRRPTSSSTSHRPDLVLSPSSEPAGLRPWLKNTLSILAILLVGAAGWAIAWKAGAWRPTPIGDEGGSTETPLGAEILGYTSAVLYLGARLPQIAKNQRERSCEGLSLLFFVLSLIGNGTYGAGILFHSVEKQYFLTNLPWLIGSLGTMAEDAVIFAQFSAFGEKRQPDAVV